MGTRNLTMVKVDGKIKVAQYGQWDGYPTGQGVTIAEFVQAYLMDATLRAEFADKVRSLKKLTKKQGEAVDRKWDEARKEAKEDAGKYGVDDVPYQLKFFEMWYSRDTGAKILRHIFNAPKPPPLAYQLAFLKDGLYCEWAYCVDLDNAIIEIYRGDTTPARKIAFVDFTVVAMRTLADEIDAAYESVHSILAGSEVA